MTGQLLKVTSTPFQAVRFTQNARLISSGSADIERRKALARMTAFQTHSTPGRGSLDVDYVNMVNRTFRTNSTVQPEAAVSNEAADVQMNDSSGSLSIAQPVSSAGSSVIASGSGTEAVPTQNVSQSVSLETDSAYTMDRGAFEFRVAKGDLTFVPPLVMTVITQRPEVHFEYLGDFNYVPPRNADSIAMNQTA